MHVICRVSWNMQIYAAKDDKINFLCTKKLKLKTKRLYIWKSAMKGIKWWSKLGTPSFKYLCTFIA